MTYTTRTVHAEQNVQVSFSIPLYCTVTFCSHTDLKKKRNLCNQCRLEIENLSVPVFRLDVVDEGLGLFVLVVAVTVVCHLNERSVPNTLSRGEEVKNIPWGSVSGPM